MATSEQIALFLGDVLAACRERGLSYDQLTTEALNIGCAAGLYAGLDEAQMSERFEASLTSSAQSKQLVATLLARRGR